MKRFCRTLILAVIFLLMLGSGGLTVESQTKPLTYPEIITALNSKLPNSVFKSKSEVNAWLVGEIKKRKAEKALSAEMEEILRQSGATEELIRTIKENLPLSTNPGSLVIFAKTYPEMSESEKKEFIQIKANEFLAKFGAAGTYQISEEGWGIIKTYVDQYAKRFLVDDEKLSDGNSDGMTTRNSCHYGRGNLLTVLKRGSVYNQPISNAFEKVGVQSPIGIYIAFTESEFCPCIQSPTGALGMFQLTRGVGENYGLKIKKEASPMNPDERCNAKAASQAAATYVKTLTDRYYGKDVNGILLTVAAYNSGEGSLNNNIKKVREQNKTNVTFWDLVENKDQLSRQFQMENYKYVPKFLAAAIIGENPKAFGIVEVQPLSGR